MINKNKFKGYMEISWELLKQLLILPIPVNIESIKINDNFEKILIKLNSNEQINFFGSPITKYISEASEIPTTAIINSNNASTLLGVKLTEMVHKMTNKEYLNIVLNLLDERPDLKEDIKRLMCEPKNERNYI